MNELDMVTNAVMRKMVDTPTLYSNFFFCWSLITFWKIVHTCSKKEGGTSSSSFLGTVDF